MDEIENQQQQIGSTKLQTRPHSVGLMRFFSLESQTSASNVSPEFSNTDTNTFYCKEVSLKIAELLIGIICAGLYSEGLKAMPDGSSISTLTFPNVVFASFLIITSVIAMSYLLGRVMPDILMRIFSAVGSVLYFTSATVTLHAVCLTRTINMSKQLITTSTTMKMLMIQVALSYFNSFLYGLDMFYSVKKAMMHESYSK